MPKLRWRCCDVTTLSHCRFGSNYCLEMPYGIPYVEMLGNEEDWRNLKTKLQRLMDFLRPIEDIIGLAKDRGRIELVCDKLIDIVHEYPRFIIFLLSTCLARSLHCRRHDLLNTEMNGVDAACAPRVYVARAPAR